jgi:protein-L-isoaspartate O-methyltransferase
MKRIITPLAAILLAVAAQAAENSDTYRPTVDRVAQALQQLKSGNFFVDSSFIVAQATEAPSQAGQQKKPDIHYVPTPQKLVEVMLDMAQVEKDDIVYDLGSGDGRLVITAAKKYGARGVGIDIDPARISEARENAKKAGVEDKVRFLEQDLFKSDFHDATVVTLYLLEELNLRLRPHIFAQVKPGTRVVSHAFTMGDWEPDAERTIKKEGENYDAYYWVVPANMNGRWNVSAGESAEVPHAAMVEQKFQNITVRPGDGGEVLGEGKVDGARFTLTIDKGAGDKPKLIRGTIDGNKIEATDTGSEKDHWSATRESGSEKPLDTPH